MFPYLFLLCSKGLSALIHKVKREERIHGISICRQAPQISHMSFADDFFLICKTTKNEVEALHHILYVYEKVSRQAINLNKFEIFFSSNTLVAKRNILSSKLGAIIVGN